MALAAILGAAVLQPNRAAPLFAPTLAPRPIFCCDAPPSEDNGPSSSLPRREVDSRGFVVPQVIFSPQHARISLFELRLAQLRTVHRWETL